MLSSRKLGSSSSFIFLSTDGWSSVLILILGTNSCLKPLVTSNLGRVRNVISTPLSDIFLLDRLLRTDSGIWRGWIRPPDSAKKVASAVTIGVVGLTSIGEVI